MATFVQLTQSLNELAASFQTVVVRARVRKGQPMSRRIGIAGILLASTFWLGGCALWEGVGPCYGVGCRAGLMAPHSQTQSAQAAPAPAAKKSRSFTAWLPFAKKHQAAAANTPSTNPAATAPAAAPAQANQGND